MTQHLQLVRPLGCLESEAKRAGSDVPGVTSSGAGETFPSLAPFPAAYAARLEELEREVAHQGVVIDMLIEVLTRIIPPKRGGAA